MKTLALKLIELKSHVTAFKKDSSSFSYDYVSGNQILSAIKDKMNELKILLIPSIVEIEKPYVDAYSVTKTDNKNNTSTKNYRDWIISGTMLYTFLNAEDINDKIEINWYLTGSQDDPSKSFGSALTYSERYFLLKFLGIPTDDADPDHKDNKKPYESKNNNQSKYYKFGLASDETLKWVDDAQVLSMISFIEDGKSDVVIPSLLKYKWSKANKDLITTKLNGNATV